MKYILLLLTIISITDCETTENQPNNFKVEYAGALKNMMHQGDIDAKMDLASFERKEHLYAIGAIERLKGEIQIFDGKPFNTIVSDSNLTVDSTFTKKATLLVYTYVNKWKSIDIPDEILTYDQLESYIGQTAEENQINTEEPFPFLIEGTPKSFDWHVINWKDGDMEHSHEKHITSGLHGTIKNRPLEILGFYSDSHHAIFTHHTTNMHLHVKTLDNKIAGHVDNLTLGEGMVLKLPDNSNVNQQTHKTTELDEQEKELYLDKGKQIAAATFAALSQLLQKAVKEGGIPNAIQYCNLAAYPITDSLSQVHQATIRRTSMKPRNSNNIPTKEEQVVLNEFTQKAAKGTPLSPIVKELDGQKIGFYAPITVNDFCLNCHGKVGQSITNENYQLIKKYYPNDKAIGYASGDLRGMWSIQLAEN